MHDVIEAGTPHRRRWIGIAVLVGVLAVPAAGLLISRNPDEPPGPARPDMALSGTPRPSTYQYENTPNLLRAEPRREGEEEAIDVVFPDGTEAEVRYPARLQLGRKGSRPTQGAWSEAPALRFRKLYAPLGGRPPNGRRIRGLTSNVSLWTFPSGQSLIYEFGDWRIALLDRPDPLTFEQRMEWARALRGRVTPGGYLVLSASKPVHLSGPGDRLGGEPAGPGLLFGGGLSQMVSLVLTKNCPRNGGIPPEVRQNGRGADGTCKGDVFVSAAGEAPFVKSALKGIKVKLRQ
ncbi:hypothetical protein [Nonomuraea dietziae]|uniref:Uncharacterized protein n=1 Tax=Nonomuraea dietziae TaxID=65515 RepID=A0A7W5VET9_9ACTN|nr:hypothetical protein [Nonomuraea dietziae]MBB3730798.1 hypothetical protein [Nonomuraea dietziae]